MRSKWQPIETAPKDGTDILVNTGWPESPVAIAYWSNSVWVDKKKGETGGWCVFDNRSDTVSCFPTIWQPVPKLPEEPA